MRLRNKKTGEIIDFKIIADYDDCTSGWRLEKQDGSVLFYDHIDEIREEWEDYPTEPLIKDEKIREIIRPWAKVNGATELKYYEGENCLEDMFRNEIHFNQALGLEDAKTYTTEELCGTPEPIEPTFVDLDERIKEKEEE